jgi:acetate kinase
VRILVVNAGSSSLKLRVLDDGDVVAADDGPATDEPERALSGFLDGAPAPDAVGHRVVHGGPEFRQSVLVDDEVAGRLEALSDLAPLHNPPALAAITTLRRLRPALPQVACFDTAFHATLPDAAAVYAVPWTWTERWGVRRYGFHGLSHSWAGRRAAELLGRPAAELRLVTCHLGAGASLAAVSGGRSVDTTMGFTPLEGLMMATRSGTVDPGLLLWLQRHQRLGAEEIEHALDRDSGLLGVSGVSADVPDVERAAGAGDRRAALALDVYHHRLAAGIAAMAAAMGGLDGVVFTGGVGQHSATVRAAACGRLGFLGVKVDAARNQAVAGDDADVSAEAASARTLVVHAREDLEIAREVQRVLA